MPSKDAYTHHHFRQPVAGWGYEGRGIDARQLPRPFSRLLKKSTEKLLVFVVLA